MRAEILSVGTELLLGQIANTNAQWISQRLAEIGVDVLHHEVVGDNLDRIADSFRLAMSRSDVVIATGGLGPTQDDITRDALAKVLGVPLVRHAEIEEQLRAKFVAYGGRMPDSNLRQADVPEGARYIVPDRGTAPGLVADIAGKRVFCVPGVPAEMREMMEGTVLPELAALAGPAVLVSRILRCTGIGESRVAELLADVFEGTENPTMAFLATSGETKIRLTAKAATRDRAEALLGPLETEVLERLGDVVFSTRDESLEEAVGRLLRAAGKTLACAESLTGGNVGARITSVAGSSDYFRGSAVAYAADAKRDVLGASEETLRGPGVVSRECALEMAAGARRLFRADIGLALTGAAGPEPHGGSAPGTVWIALDGDDRRHTRKLSIPGERDRVRRWAEQAALDLLRRYLEGKPLPESDRII